MRIFAIYPYGVYTVDMKLEAKKKARNRLSRIEGQVRGLQKMLEENEYCIDIINQSAAVRSALSALEDKVLENHLSEHVIDQMKGDDAERAIAEVISVFKTSKKK